MGRLSEYDDEEQGSISYPVEKERDSQLGARVRELLVSEEPPEGLVNELYGYEDWQPGPSGEHLALQSWAWFREQLLGDLQVQAPGSLQTGGATAERLGPLTFYDGLGFWVGGDSFEAGGVFHHAHKDILQEAADAWNREQTLMTEIRQRIRRQSEAEEDANGR